MILLWRRRNRMEKARLEQRLQNYNKEYSKYAANVERRKRAIVQEFDSVRRTSGNSPCGLPVNGRQVNAYAESRYSKSGFRLSEKRLMVWKQAERELERFLKRTQIGKLPTTSYLPVHPGRATTKPKKCLNPGINHYGERTLKEQQATSDYTAKIFKLYLENDGIRSKLEYRTPLDKTPKLDKSEFMKFSSTAQADDGDVKDQCQADDDDVKDQCSGSDGSQYASIRTTDLNFNSSESIRFHKAASSLTGKSLNLENSDYLKTVRTTDKLDNGSGICEINDVDDGSGDFESNEVANGSGVDEIKEENNGSGVNEINDVDEVIGVDEINEVDGVIGVDEINEVDDGNGAGEINEDIPRLSSVKKRRNHRIKLVAKKHSSDIIESNNAGNQTNKTRRNGSVKESEQKSYQSRKTDKNKPGMRNGNFGCGKNIAVSEDRRTPRPPYTNEVLRRSISDISGRYIRNMGYIFADESLSVRSNVERPLVNIDKKPDLVAVNDASYSFARTKSEDIPVHCKLESSCNEDLDKQLPFDSTFPSKPESINVKFSSILLTNNEGASHDEQNKNDKQLTFQSDVSPGDDVKCETSPLKYQSDVSERNDVKCETSLKESQRKLSRQMRRKSTDDFRKRPKSSSVYSAPTRPSTTPIRQRRWTTDVCIEYPPAIHTKISLEYFFKTALVFSKSTRKTRLNRLVDEFCPDINERVRQERLNELKDRSLHLSNLVNKFNPDNPQRISPE